MGKERLALSVQERGQLKVLHAIEQGDLKQVEAARPGGWLPQPSQLVGHFVKKQITSASVRTQHSGRPRPADLEPLRTRLRQAP